MSANTSRNAQVSGVAVGVTLTAAIILIIGGVCHAMEGFVGLATNEFYVTTQKWIFKFDVTTWGWIHILVGVLAVWPASACSPGRSGPAPWESSSPRSASW